MITDANLKDGVAVQVKASWSAHNEKFGTIRRVVRRPNGMTTLVYVDVPGVRDLLLYPPDLELA